MAPAPRAATLLLLLGAATLAACGDNQDDAGARDLLARVRAADYRSWDRAPGWPARATRTRRTATRSTST